MDKQTYDSLQNLQNIQIDEQTKIKLKKEFKELNLSNDFLFSHVMKDPEICRQLLEEILNINVDKIVYNEEQKSLKPGYGDRGVRFDAYVKSTTPI